MSEITRVYEFRIYNAAGDAVEFTFSDDALVGVPQFGWGTPRPLDGKVENIPSTVRINDDGEQVTSILSDGDGRTILLGRIGEIRINESGGGLATVMKGRITGIYMADIVSAYDFQISNERWLEQAEVFDSGGTTQIMPPGLVDPWENISVARKMTLEVIEVIDANRLIFDVLNSGLMGSRVSGWLDSDVQRKSPQTGNFLFTRLNASAGDREIISFGFASNAGATSAEDPLGYLRQVIEGGQALYVPAITIYWPGHGLNVGDEISEAYVYAPGAPADEDLPIHVGGASGQDPFDWIKGEYDTLGVNYESDAFSAWNAVGNPNGLIAHPLIPLMFIRATKPVKLRVQVEKICRTFGIIPFVNSSGEVAPRFVLMPHDVDPSTLPEITAAIAAPPHPTWGQQAVNMVTVCRPIYSQYREIQEREIRENSNVNVDRVHVVVRKLTDINHDRLSQLEAHVYDMDLTILNTLQKAEYLARQMSRELFDRYGDGAIQGQVEALSGASGVEPGDFVRLTVSSYPDMATSARGGTRVVQAMGRETLISLTFSYLDAGPDSQPLTAPGVAIAQTAGDTHHSVDVTVSSLTAGARYQLQLKIGSADYVTVSEGSANETVTITEMPSGTTILARARETKAVTIRSEWSASDSVVTATLSAPTNAVVGSIAGDRATASWTNNEVNYHLEVFLNGTQLDILEPGTTEYLLTSLIASTTYNAPGFAVRHLDRYGGASATDTDDFATTGVNTTLSQPFTTAILVGGAKV